MIPTPTPDALAATLLHRPCDRQEVDLSGLPSPGLSEGLPGMGAGPVVQWRGGGFLLSFEPTSQLQRPQRWAEPGPGRGLWGVAVGRGLVTGPGKAWGPLCGVEPLV